MRAYAIERARAAGELEALRDAHVTFWLDWLDRHEPIVHTDAVIEHIELFHDSVAAALEWSTRDPAVGLRLLRLLARAWHGSGRPQAALTAVDRLLTDENAERFPLPWAAAAATVCRPRRHRSELVRGEGLLLRGRAVADQAGDEYFVAVNDMLLGYTADNCERVRRLAHERGQRYVECIATMGQAPSRSKRTRARRWRCSTTPTSGPAARESRYLRDFADRTAGRAALYLGDLERCLELARGLCSSPSLLMAESAVRLLGVAGLLARDESAVDAAAAVAQRAPRQGSRHAGLGGLRDPSTLAARWSAGPGRPRPPAREHRAPAIRCRPTS